MPFLQPGAAPSYPPQLELIPLHKKIVLKSVDLSKRAISAEVTITVENPSPYSNEPQQRRRLKLNAVSFQVSSVEPAHVATGLEEKTTTNAIPATQNSDLKFTYDGKILDIVWHTIFAPKERRAVKIVYQVTTPVTGLRFGPEGCTEPEFAVTDHETERARHWLPCVDFPFVRTSLDFHITAKKEYTIVANGALQDETIDEKSQTKTVHWSLKQRSPSYLICFAVGKFVQVNDGDVNGVPVAYLALDSTPEEELRLSFGKTPKMLKWMQKKLGENYPFPKYYQLAVPNQGGAMENISLVTWEEALVMNKHLHDEWSQLVDTINVHEMAHAYFGDLLVIKHFNEAWLKEGWAKYMEAVWLEDEKGPEEFQYMMYINRNTYICECQTRYTRPTVTRKYNSSWQLYDSHLYPGGAWRLHMLREMLGNDIFWKGVQRYIKDYKGKVVTTVDFRRSLESVSMGKDLTQFFDQWIYGKSYPTLAANFSYDPVQNTAMIKLHQIQKKEETANGSYFQFNIDVEIEDQEGYQIAVAQFDENGKACVSFSVRGSPLQVCLDPNNKVIFAEAFTPGETFLGYTLKNHRSVPRRIWAGKSLINIGTPSALAMVKSAMESEAFWGVRVQMADQYAVQRTARSLAQLSELLDRETHPEALSNMLMNCGSSIDPTLRRALLSFLKRPNIPYRAHARALEALANQKNKQDIELIKGFVDKKSRHGFVESGALTGLGRIVVALDINKEEDMKKASNILSILEEKTKKSTMRQIRPAAVSALANAAKNLTGTPVLQRNRIVGLLIQFLRDSDISVRKAAVGGLVLMKAKEAALAISQVKHTLSIQDGLWISQQVNELNSANSQNSGELNKTIRKVNEMQKKIRQLEIKHNELKTLEVKHNELKSQLQAQQAQQKKASKSTRNNEIKWGQATVFLMIGAVISFGIGRISGYRGKL